MNEAHKQYSLLDTIFNYIFYFGPPGKHLYLSPQNPLLVGRPAVEVAKCFLASGPLACVSLCQCAAGVTRGDPDLT